MQIDQVYFLAHAFDRLGRRLYGRQWQGDEAWAESALAPEELAADRDNLITQVAEVNACLKTNRHALLDAATTAEIDSLTAEKAMLEERRAALHEDLHAAPEAGAAYQAKYDRYCRFQAAEETLKRGLWYKEITALYGPQQIVDWRAWSRQPGFKVIIDLSLAIAPKTLCGTRRATVFFNRVDFDNWLEKVEPLIEEDLEAMPPEDRARRFLMVLARGSKEHSKPEYLAMAQERIPGLSEKRFNVVWDEVAPDPWKKAGRPSSQGN